MPLDGTPIVPNSLPAILCGPIVRRLTRTQVSVWVALSRGDAVSLHVQEQGNSANLTTVTEMPVRIGRHLYLAVLTVDGVSGGNFQPATTYHYWLTSPGWPAAPDWSGFAYSPVSIPAAGSTTPTFVGLPDNLGDFNVLHLSCRRPHAGRRDGLAHGHRLISGDLAARPHLLIMSGDQIYADDAATLLMARLRRIDIDLVDIDESAVFNPIPLFAGRQAPSEAMGLSSGEAKDHLWTLGEFYAMYLLAWSDVLWPSTLPHVLGDVDTTEIALQINGEDNPAMNAGLWTQEIENLSLMKETLPDVRRLLANVPTLMMFDDHEITDDWNLDFNWIDAVYNNAQGRRVISNGLLAYTLFQQWGNRPDRFSNNGTVENDILTAARRASDNARTHPADANASLLAQLGVPSSIAPLPANGRDFRDVSTGTAIRYDFTLGPTEGYPLRIVLLDERTVRHFAEDDKPAGRISTNALDLMLPIPAGNAADIPTLLITPAPVLGLHLIEHVLQPVGALIKDGEKKFDFESWSAFTPTFEHLLDRISAYRQVAILSGDVHFCYTKSMTYHKPANTATPSRAAQFVASAGKYAMGKTLMLHLLGDTMQQLGIVRTRTFHGFNALNQAQRNALEAPPPSGSVLPYDDLVDVLFGRVLREGSEQPAVFSDAVASAYGLAPADWTYTIEHIADERFNPPTDLADAMATATANGDWDGWNRQFSIDMVRALRASNLHTIGRIFAGLPIISRISFNQAATLAAQQELFISVGEDEASGRISTTITSVDLG